MFLLCNVTMGIMCFEIGYLSWVYGRVRKEEEFCLFWCGFDFSLLFFPCCVYIILPCMFFFFLGGFPFNILGLKFVQGCVTVAASAGVVWCVNFVLFWYVVC